MLMAFYNRKWILNMKQDLKATFSITNLSECNHCLGMELIRNRQKLQMTQKLYPESLLHRFGMG